MSILDGVDQLAFVRPALCSASISSFGVFISSLQLKTIVSLVKSVVGCPHKRVEVETGIVVPGR